MPAFPQSYSFRDVTGRTSWLRFFIFGTTRADAETAATTLLAVITPVTNAAFQRANGAYTTPLAAPTYGVNALFPDCDDKLVMNWATNQGTRYKIAIPAPISAIFLPDGETLDRANALATALINTIVTQNLRSRDNQRLTTYIGSIRERVELRRKFGLLVKNPQGTTPSL